RVRRQCAIAVRPGRPGEAAMTEDEAQPIEDEVLVTPEPDPVADLEVTYVVPPPAYDSIATEVPEPLEEARPAPAPLDLSPAIGAISSLGEGLHRKLDGLQTLFDREIRAEATREKVVDRLHAEL